MSNHNADIRPSVNLGQENAREPRALTLSGVHASLIDQLVERESKRLGETPERVRRLVELGVLTRGIAAMQEDGS